MCDTIELLITSDSTGSLCSSAVWDIATGTCLHLYKGGGTVTQNTLSIIRNDYIIAAERLKPLLHVWPINSQEILKNIRIVVPGKVLALAVSNNGLFCAAGIEEKLYIWQIATGRLLSIASKHFQSISKVLFTSDDSHIVTAGEDGLVLIWPVAHLVSQQGNDLMTQSIAGQTDPLYTISDHSTAVKDICIGKSGLNARLITVSSDRTMKVYQVVSGTLLLSVVFDVCLSAVTMNVTESCVFIGTVDGQIFELSLLNPSRNREYHANKSEISTFNGHTKCITTLTVSTDGQTLVSGSMDEQVIIWHIQTKQKLRTLLHKGPITNAFFVLSPKNMFCNDLKPSTVISSFQRTTEEDLDGVIEVINTKDQYLPFSVEENNEDNRNDFASTSKDLECEINKLKAINAKLYSFTLSKIMQASKETNSNDNNKTKKRKITIV